MTAILLALAPIFLLIVLGWGMKRSDFVPEGFWGPAEKITYYVFFPALLLVNAATADLGALDVMPMMAALAAAVIVTVGVMVSIRKALGVDGPGFTSVVQGAIRPNTYVSIAAAMGLFGDAGLTLAAVGIITVIPLVNLISVTFLVHYAAPEREYAGWRVAFKPVITNPLILACLAGAMLNVTGAGLPEIARAPLEVLGRAALPLGLLAVGAGLDFQAAREAKGVVLVASAAKLLLTPGLVFFCAVGFGIEGVTRDVAVLYMAVPASASSYVLARQMGGDARLMAGIITASTLLAAVTMPLVVQALP